MIGLLGRTSSPRLRLAAALVLIVMSAISCGDDKPSPTQPPPQDEPLVDVTTLGADSTGQSDCSAILQLALDEGKSLRFPPGVYRVDTGLAFSADSTRYVFDGASLTSPNPIRLVTLRGTDILIDGLTIDMNQSPVDRFAIEILKPSRNVRLTGCTVRNLRGRAGDKFQCGLRLDLDGVNAFEIDNCQFENIELRNDGDAAELDFANGIYLSTGTEPATPSTGKISDCVFRNIFNSTTGADERIDSDAIRFFSTGNLPGSTPSPRIEISRCRFVDCQKRAIKVSHMADVLISDIEVTNSRTDAYQHEAVKIHGASERIHVRELAIEGNVLRGIWISEARDVSIEGMSYDRQATFRHGVTVSWAIRLERDEGEEDFLRDIHCRNIEVRNAKALRVANAENVDVATVVVRSMGSGPYDTDGDDDPSTTFFDKIFDIESARNVTAQRLEVLARTPNVPTALRVADSRQLQFVDCWFRGWGNGVLEVAETAGNVCSEISFRGGGIEQVGYLAGGSGSAQTVVVRSDNNGTPEDGVSGISIADWEVTCAQQPSGLNGYDFVCLFETPGAVVDGMSVRYLGASFSSISSILFLTHVSGAVFRNANLASPVSARAFYLVESTNAELDEITICVPGSWATVDTGSADVELGVFRVLEDFARPIANVTRQPAYLSATCE